jgi:hypothetical protein
VRRGEPAGAAGQALGVRAPLLGALVGPGIASIGNAWGRVSPSVLAAIEERLRLLLGLA